MKDDNSGIIKNNDIPIFLLSMNLLEILINCKTAIYLNNLVFLQVQMQLKSEELKKKQFELNILFKTMQNSKSNQS